MISTYESYFVFGKRGRFGSRIAKSLKDKHLLVFEYASAEFDEGLRALILELKDRKNLCVIWCFGAGSSIEVSIQNKEYQLLLYMFSKLTSANLPPINSMFVFLSSGGKMYGINTGIVSESSENLPVSLYGQQKRDCEQLLLTMAPRFFHNLIIFRPANAYSIKSLNSQPKGFVERCLWAIEHDKTIKFIADPNSQRQYGSHSDYANAMLSLIGQTAIRPSWRIINVAPNFTYDLYQVIASFEEYFKKKIIIEPFEVNQLIQDSIILKSEVFRPDFVWNSIAKNLDLSRL